MGRNRVIAPVQQSIKFSTSDVHLPAANTAAVVTYAAVTTSSGTAGVGNQPVPVGYLNSANLPQTVSHVILGFVASVDSATILAANPVVHIQDGSGNKVFEAHLPMITDPKSDASGKAMYFLDFRFPVPVRGTAGRALIITMPANGANTTNKLNILGHHTSVA